MPVNTYDASTTVRLRSGFTVAQSGDPADPASVKLWVSDPSGTITEYTEAEMTHESTGVFYMDVVLDMVGVWTYKWQGLGGVEAASPDIRIIVDKTKFPIVS